MTTSSDRMAWKEVGDILTTVADLARANLPRDIIQAVRFGACAAVDLAGGLSVTVESGTTRDDVHQALLAAAPDLTVPEVPYSDHLDDSAPVARWSELLYDLGANAWALTGYRETSLTYDVIARSAGDRVAVTIHDHELHNDHEISIALSSDETTFAGIPYSMVDWIAAHKINPRRFNLD